MHSPAEEQPHAFIQRSEPIGNRVYLFLGPQVPLKSMLTVAGSSPTMLLSDSTEMIESMSILDTCQKVAANIQYMLERTLFMFWDKSQDEALLEHRLQTS